MGLYYGSMRNKRKHYEKPCKLWKPVMTESLLQVLRVQEHDLLGSTWILRNFIPPGLPRAVSKVPTVFGVCGKAFGV